MTESLQLPLGDVAKLCQRYGVTELSIFGSAARGELRSDSDIDFLYTTGSDAPAGSDFFTLGTELERLLHRGVDLVPKNYLHWVIRDRVLAEARVVYARD